MADEKPINKSRSAAGGTAQDNRAAIDACKRAMEPLAGIKIPGVEANAQGREPQTYRIHRAGQQTEITGEHIAAARECLADADATLTACVAALKPLASLPIDHTVRDVDGPLYTFPGQNQLTVSISTREIDAARRARVA